MLFFKVYWRKSHTFLQYESHENRKKLFFEEYHKKQKKDKINSAYYNRFRTLENKHYVCLSTLRDAWLLSILLVVYRIISFLKSLFIKTRRKPKIRKKSEFSKKLEKSVFHGLTQKKYHYLMPPSFLVRFLLCYLTPYSHNGLLRANYRDFFHFFSKRYKMGWKSS